MGKLPELDVLLLVFFTQIYDGDSVNSRLIGTYCGTQTVSFHSSRNSLTFRFSSDSSVSGKGFLLEWFATNVSEGVLPTVAPGLVVSFLGDLS